MLKLTSGIFKKQLETKLVMETLSGEIVEPYRFEPPTNSSEVEGGRVHEDENTGHVFGRFCFSFNRWFIREGFCIS